MIPYSARSRKDMTMAIDKEQAQGGAKEQKERFKTLLTEVVKCHEGQLSVYIPPDNPREYPLRRKNGDDPVRAWALGEYINRYGENGKVANYEAARAELWLERGEPAQENEGQGQEQGRGRGRPKSEQSIAEKFALEAIKKYHDLSLPARKPGAFYFRVPYLKDEPGLSRLYTGIWYVTEKSITRLLDAAVYPLEVRRPQREGKTLVTSGRLKFVTTQGRERVLPFDNVVLKDGIETKLVGDVIWPQLPTDRYRLIEAINEVLFTIPVQDYADSLGWVFQD